MKLFKYILVLAALLFLGYNSVYFEKLSEVRAQEETAFDFQAFAENLYYEGLLKKVQPVDLSELLSAIQTDTEGTFEEFGNRLGIGNSAYFMVRCTGEISKITEGQIELAIDSIQTIRVDTKYIFGNALRDASGLVQLTDFKTNAEFNKVSEALNALIRKKVIPEVVQQLQQGDPVEVAGAVKLSKKDLDQPNVIITPAQIKPL